MDVKETIAQAVEKLTKDKDLLEKFQKDPVKTLEGVLGVDLPDEMLEKVAEGVKAGISLDRVGDVMDTFKKLF